MPVTGPQPLASVILYGRLTPAATPVNIPVLLVWLLKVYEYGDVPPEAMIVTVAVPPKQGIGDVTVALVNARAVG